MRRTASLLARWRLPRWPLGQPIPSARAQATADLPKAETILDQYVEATGGKIAYEKLKNRTMSGTIEVLGVGVKGTLKITQAAPNKLIVETDLGAPLAKQEHRGHRRPVPPGCSRRCSATGCSRVRKRMNSSSRRSSTTRFAGKKSTTRRNAPVSRMSMANRPTSSS